VSLVPILLPCIKKTSTHVNSSVHTSTDAFLESSGVSSLSMSYTILQVTQPGLMRPQLVSRWLATYAFHASPLLSHNHHEALTAALVVLRMALLFLSPSMHKLLKGLANERAANPLHPNSTGRHLTLHFALRSQTPILLGSCQSLAEVRMPADVTLPGIGCSPALTMPMACLERQGCFAHSTPALMASAVVFRT